MPSGNKELILQPSSTYVAPVPYRGHNIFLGLRALDHFRNNYLNPMVTSRLNTVIIRDGSLTETSNNMEYYRRTSSPKRMLRLDDNTYKGGNLGGITVTKERKKPYWVSPRGAGNMTVMPGDPEMVFFAPNQEDMSRYIITGRGGKTWTPDRNYKQGGKLIPKGLKGLIFPNINEFTPELIKEINDKAWESITSHSTYKDSSRPLSGTDPIMAALASYYTGTKGISALYNWLLSRYTQGLANTYKKLRENNQDIQSYTGNNKRHENILFADKEARRLGPTYNNQGPLGFLYDTLLDPAIRGYTKILDKYPLLNIILP